MRKRMSIKWKLMGYLLAFVGGTFLLLWLFQMVLLDSFYYHIKTMEVQRAAEVILRNRDKEAFAEMVDQYTMEKNLCLSVFTEDGQELARVERMPDCTIHHMDAQARAAFFSQVKHNGGVLLQTRVQRQPFNAFDRTELENRRNWFFPPLLQKEDDNEWRSLTYGVLVQDGEEQYVLALDTVLTPLSATQEILRVELLYICVILAVVSVLLAYVIYRHISRPLIETTKKAKTLAQGNLSVDFDQDDYEEIGQLNETLNYAAKELKKTEALQRELLSNISHDLRTPLTLITGYAEMMRDIPGENTAENLQVVIDEGRWLSELVTDLLDLSKLQAGVEVLTLSRFSLTGQIRSMLERYNKLQEQEGYQILFSYTEEVYVVADEIKMTQVLYNLVNNAINYTGEDKQVFLTQTVLHGWVCIEVADTGEGISPEDLPYIWDRYYKVDRAHQRGKMGTGLGLSIVKQILEKHHAGYGVRPRPGGGSIFWFSLEISDKETTQLS